MGEEWYRAQGIEVLDTDRGGRVTYHGPGQLVGYPVVSLRAYGDDVARYVRGLEELIVAVLASYGIRAGTIEGLTGVWTEDRRKIGSIGIHVSRGVTTHGFAVNVNNDLQPFEWVVPCGIDHCRMSSVARERREAVDLDELSRRACAEFGHIFGREPVSVTRAALDRAQAVPA
jgi:lipoate-protein ligase B